MEEQQWWPQGIAISPSDEARETGQLDTKWGAVSCWDVQACLQSDWWNSQKDGSWGILDDINPSTIEVVRTDENRTLFALDALYIALAYSIPTSNRTSSLYQNKDIYSRLQSTNIHLPIGGMLLDGKDALVVFPAGKLTESSPEWLGQTLGNIQNMLAPLSSPNDQKRWNQRLKDLEDELKPNTLWRAPHASATKGIPAVRIHPNYIVEVEGEHCALPLNQTASEALLCGTERLPGIAEFIHLEGRVVEEKGYKPEQIDVLFENWKRCVPASWTSRKALSTVLGGAWIWRYYDVLVVTAESVLYGNEPRYKSSQKWLKDVSRLQAHLGVLRVWKSGVWVGITTMVVAYYAWQLETLSSTSSVGLAVLGSIISIGSNFLYWKKDPPAF
ncbi:MAG: Uncharacterised protein [Candidatus Poseidoniaceae archaeon]|nr:MAG: Uncharacterised protein [Candidatus Poseidoniaceae archaeon]